MSLITLRHCSIRLLASLHEQRSPQWIGARKSTIPQVRYSHFPFSLSSSGYSLKNLSTPLSMRASRAVKLMFIFMRQSPSIPFVPGELVAPYPMTSWLSLSKTCIPIEWNGEYFAPAPLITEDPVWSTAFHSWQKSDAVKLSSRMSASIVRSIWSRLCSRDRSMSLTTGVLGNPRYLAHQSR